MPKLPHKFKIVAYDKDSSCIGTYNIKCFKDEFAYSEFLEMFDLVSDCQLPNVCRIDLVSANRILFSMVALRNYINQRNLTINFNPY